MQEIVFALQYSRWRHFSKEWIAFIQEEDYSCYTVNMDAACNFHVVFVWSVDWAFINILSLISLYQISAGIYVKVPNLT